VRRSPQRRPRIPANNHQGQPLSKALGHTFGDRQSTAAEAKKALLERFKAKKQQIDATAESRQAELMAIEIARQERKAQREAEKAREAEERARREAEERAEAERKAAEAKAEWDAQQSKLRPRSNANRGASADLIARVIADQARLRAERLAPQQRKTGS
jgi:hypothetical protein